MRQLPSTAARFHQWSSCSSSGRTHLARVLYRRRWRYHRSYCACGSYHSRLRCSLLHEQKKPTANVHIGTRICVGGQVGRFLPSTVVGRRFFTFRCVYVRLCAYRKAALCYVNLLQYLSFIFPNDGCSVRILFLQFPSPALSKAFTLFAHFLKSVLSIPFFSNAFDSNL